MITLLNETECYIISITVACWGLNANSLNKFVFFDHTEINEKVIFFSRENYVRVPIAL